MTASYESIHKDVRYDWTREHHNFLGWATWAPFRNERHFNYAVRVALDELAERAADVDWLGEGQATGPREDVESKVIAAVIDIVIEECFPSVDRESVFVRMAVRFAVRIIVRRIHERLSGDESEYPEQVKQWAIQSKVLLSTE